MKFGLLKYGVCMVMLLLFLGTVNVNAIGAGALFAENSIDPTEFEMFSQNNISFYDPTDCLSSGNGGRGASVLSGNTIEEKIWNYFVQAGIPGVSDDAAVIAGIMGNFYAESGYNPFMRGSNLKYRALWMLMDSYNGKQYASKLASDINSAVGGNYWKFYGWWGSTDDADKKLASAGVPQSAIDTAITMELDYLTKSEEYKSDWDGFVNNFDWVTNKTPSGYSDLFLVKVERAVNGGSPIADPGVRSHVKGSYQGSAKRRAAAEDVYSRLAGAGGASGASVDVAGGSTSSSSSSSNSSYVNLASVTTEVTLIGDSISVYSESELMKKFPNSFLNKVGSRHPTTKGWCDGDEGGLSVLKKIVSGSGTIMNQHQGQSKCEAVSVDSSALKENVVWALGTNTNGAKNQSTLEGVLEAIGGRKLYLVTPYNMIPDKMGDTDEIADLYRSFADAHDNVYIIDWNKNVRDNATQYIDNSDHLGVHPTSAGSELFAKLIAEAVSGSKSCTTYSGDYPQYLQCDAKWKDDKYGGSTMCDAGCGPASLAMLVTVATGKDVLPTDVAALTEDPPYYEDNVGGEWMRKQNTMKVCEKYGCEVKEVENNEDAIRQALKEGWMIHLSGGGGSTASETAFPTDGHYVGIFSIDDEDNVMIADPAGDAHQNKKGRFNRKLTLNNALKDRWKDRPIMAIRGSGGNSGKNTCEVVGNFCAADGDAELSSVGGQVGEGGLTYEEAVRFMQNYGENKNNASKKAAGSVMWNMCNGGGSNCVTFSVFFLNKFTGSKPCSIGGRCGNGYEILNYISNIDKSMGNNAEPRVWAVFSYYPIHTGIILGYHDGEWIVGHASCSNNGIGRGNGTTRHSGSGYVKKSSNWRQAVSLGDMTSLVGFGYPRDVDVSAIERFRDTGE